MNKKLNFLIIATFFFLLCSVAMSTIYAADVPKQEEDAKINEILTLVNSERAKQGLNPLTIDSDLNSAAKIRSQEISVLFEHVRPDGSSITTLCPKIRSENLGITTNNANSQYIMNGWMNSQSHKNNILNPSFTTIGIGYYKYTLPNGGINYTWVQLFGVGKASEPIKVTLIQVGGLTVTSTSTSQVSLRWNGQINSNAHGYQVYRYNPNTNSFIHIKTIVGNNINSFTDFGLLSSTVYSYKVRSYLVVNGQTKYGDFSSVIKTNTRPITPFISKLVPGKKKVTVSWNKVSRVNGYQIFRSTSKFGKYSLLKTVKQSSPAKITNIKLKKGTYYYKIRSYTIINNVRVYSSFSTIRSVRVR